jgi:hypothetical protein
MSIHTVVAGGFWDKNYISQPEFPLHSAINSFTLEEETTGFSNVVQIIKES